MQCVPRCEVCGSTQVRVIGLDISTGMSGESYDFCEQCLKGMSADDFLEHLFLKWGLVYPPQLADWAQKAVDKRLHPSEIIYGGKDSAATQRVRGVQKSKPGKAVGAKERERRKLTNSLRYRVMRRDAFHCVLCGATGKEDRLVVDHILPISKGGKTTITNLRALCQTCNSGKFTKLDSDTD